MSESRTETVAGIVADMREQAQILDLGNDDVKVFADRIEAAWKREREGAERRGSQATMAEVCKTLEAVRSGLDPGNVAAMREALKYVTHMDDDDFSSYEVEEAISKACSALAAPARNCDRFATLDAARKAFYSGYFGPTEAEYIQQALLSWLFDPAEGEMVTCAR